jgi:hypothetical protein
MEHGSLGTHMRVGQALLVGHLLVTLPVLLFICGLTFLGMFVALFILPFQPLLIFVFLIIGFALAWTWWSLLIPKWRNWAHRQGIPPDELQKWAVRTGLVWPKGWIFEKTEIRFKDEDN